MKKTAPMVALGLAAVLLAPLPVRAQISIAPHAAWGDQADLALGGRLVLGMPGVGPRLEASLAFDWFVDCDGCTYYEVTPALALSMGALGIGAYAGAGVNVARTTLDDDDSGDSVEDTELGAAFLLGVRVPFGLFGEVRITAGGAAQRVLTVGFRLGG